MFRLRSYLRSHDLPAFSGVRMLVLKPNCPAEELAADIMRRILADDLLGVAVKDADVNGDSDVLERSVSILWSCGAFEQISGVIRDFVCGECSGKEDC